MRRISGVLAALCLILSTAAAAEWSIEAMNRTIESSNFMVNRGCSGTLIDLKNRYVLTANHCITDQYEIVERQKFKDDGTVVEEKIRRVLPGKVQQLSFDGATEVRTVTYRTKLVLADRENDLALLQIVATSLPNAIAAELACAEPTRGETAYAVGNPMGVLYSSVTKGIVSSTQRSYDMFGIDDQGDNALLQISSGIIGGNSGGAVYNSDGRLIGVPVRGHRTNEIIGLAAPLTNIKKFLTRQGLSDLWAYCEKPAEKKAAASTEAPEEPLVQLGIPQQ
jgi:S1-C subfamily serine protease